MHLGNAYSFLIAWAIARRTGAKVILRIDDLDDRCKNKDNKEAVVKDLEWLGIDWDGEIEFQSKRLELYKQAWSKLKVAENLYPCFCSRANLHVANAPHTDDGTPIYSGKCKSLTKRKISEMSKVKIPSWRIEVPDEIISFKDEIFGEVSQNLKKECGDFVLQRSDGIFSYHFCNCVDDLEMEIDQVVRGCDLLACTPQQIWLKNRLAQAVPDFHFNSEDVHYYHLPLFINESGQRLAKRDASLSLAEIKARDIPATKVIAEIANMIGIAQNCEQMTSSDFLEAFDARILKNKKEFIVKSDLF